MFDPMTNQYKSVIVMERKDFTFFSETNPAAAVENTGQYYLPDYLIAFQWLKQFDIRNGLSIDRRVVVFLMLLALTGNALCDNVDSSTGIFWKILYREKIYFIILQIYVKNAAL